MMAYGDNEWVKSLVARVLSMAVAVTLVGCGGSDESPAPTAPSGPSVAYSQTDLQVGTGADAVAGRRVTVYYTGWLYSATAPENKGTQFDSRTSGPGFEFILGTGQVIRGWDVGVVGMKGGGRRRLVIPADLAYGSAGRPPAIPGNAALVFDVELLAVQ